MTLGELAVPICSSRPRIVIRMPIAGLYLCGSGACPSGGVTGAGTQWGTGGDRRSAAKLNIGISCSNNSIHRPQ